MIKKMNYDEFAYFVQENDATYPSPDVYPPELDDLYYLYSFVRDTSAVAVMELGGGYSTLAMAQGLKENELSFGEAHNDLVRHPNPFKMISIDASKEFSQIARSRMPSELVGIVEFHVSTVSIAQWGGNPGQMCSFYDDFPNFCPDLVYLDGPDSDQVEGAVRGFQVEQPHSVPMGADLLSVEPQLWPGTHIVTDGRMANAHFLKSNFRRHWEFFTDFYGNRVVMRLASEPFGEVSSNHTKVRLESSRVLRNKELPLLPK